MVDTTRVSPEEVLVKCVGCKTSFAIPFTEDQQTAWQNGALIQNVSPEMNADMRELLISGTCPTCWDLLFSDDSIDGADFDDNDNLPDNGRYF